MALEHIRKCLFYTIVLYIEVLAQIRYNTLSTALVRATTFVPKVTLKMCLLKPDVGPCRGNIDMYYYDPTSSECKLFKWGGCQGNGNRFDTKTECNNVCLTKPDTPKMRPRWCYLTFDYGFCFGAINRWYYDPMWKVCKQRIYSGCGGNKNNFYSFEQCESVCRFGLGKIQAPTKSSGVVKKVVIINTNYAKTGRGRTSTTIVENNIK
ncbi:tissue factor pathway inhibitor-like [Achroia grisella]|uniref:tissue factor pathway inhibitor-like n=1 Tax=Achroia grisella TaxID=688607 RepID=UPI0027D2557E|nr:tissue factor pathway inhibitor-like [Achroia grisella]